MTADNRQQTTDNRQRAVGSKPSFTSREAPASRRKYSFQNLTSWNKAQDLADRVLDIVDRLPNTRAANVIVTQIVKSSSSIAANICEGHGRFAAGAYRNHLSIARGSANETISWIDLLRRRGYINMTEHDELVDLCEEIIRMVSAQMIQLDRQTNKASAFREEGEPYVAD